MQPDQRQDGNVSRCCFVPVACRPAERVPDIVTNANRFDRRRARGGKWLVCYFPVGDPLLPPELLECYAASGVDVVELGLPTTDPFMDGEDVAASMRRALSAGWSTGALEAGLAVLERADDPPAALCMSYADRDLVAELPGPLWSRLDGLLSPGLESRPDWPRVESWAQAHDVRLAKFIGAALAPEQLANARRADAYLMLQAVDGVTGPRDDLSPDNAGKIQQLRQAGFQQPILLGFGIGSAAQARQAVQLGADGIIVGSMCLRQALAGADRLRGFLGDLREALDG